MTYRVREALQVIRWGTTEAVHLRGDHAWIDHHGPRQRAEIWTCRGAEQRSDLWVFHAGHRGTGVVG